MLPDVREDSTLGKMPDALTAVVYLDDGDVCGGKSNYTYTNLFLNSSLHNLFHKT
jgi:hypothetical protein